MIGHRRAVALSRAIFISRNCLRLRFPRNWRLWHKGYVRKSLFQMFVEPTVFFTERLDIGGEALLGTIVISRSCFEIMFSNETTSDALELSWMVVFFDFLRPSIFLLLMIGRRWGAGSQRPWLCHSHGLRLRFLTKALGRIP